MKQFLKIILLLGLISGLMGCVTIFGRKRQNVSITSPTIGSKVSVDDTNMQSNTVTQKLEKKLAHDVTASKEGFKSRHGVISAERLSYAVYPDIALIPLFYGLFGLVVDALFSPIKMSRFDSDFEFAPLKKLPKKNEEEKFIWVQDVIVNIQKGDVLGKFYGSLRKLENSKKYTEYRSNEKILYDVPIFKHDMNEILESYGYSDTSENVIASSWNSLYLTSEIKTLNTNLARLKARRLLFGVQVKVEWTLYDGFGNEIFGATTSGDSDYRLGSNDFDEGEFKLSVKDAIEYAMIDLCDDPKFQELLNLDIEFATGMNNPVTNVDVTLPSTENVKVSLEDQMNSILRVTSDKRLYSGTVISRDGYIVTSYEAISSGEELIVEIKNEQVSAKVISSNSQLNLALLKVESENLIPISWNQAKAPNIGDRVYTLSFSNLEMLDKYVSSGIVSGFRSFQSKEYIQSDVPMSFGNSGGTMVDDNGQIIGILNAKANSEDVEGIGFAVPIESVLTGLNIILN